MGIQFSIQGRAADARTWLELAYRADRSGIGRLYCADHPGLTPSPVAVLSAAAAVTETVHLGALVMNLGVREPFDLASDIAAVDLMSGGRAVLGVGAGHNPVEWGYYGRSRPDVDARIDRTIEVADAALALLAGETVTLDGPHVRLRGALLERPRPIQDPIPLLVGGSNRRLLRYAAANADIISLSGLGRTLPDGYSHQIRWDAASIDSQLELIHDATPAGRTPLLEALVQRVEITDDAEAAAATMLQELDQPGITTAEVLEAPYLMIGTVSEIVARIRRNAAVRGIGGYAVRAAAFDDLERIRAALVAGGPSG